MSRDLTPGERGDLTRLGRHVLDAEDRLAHARRDLAELVAHLRSHGVSMTDMAGTLGLTRQALYKALRR